MVRTWPAFRCEQRQCCLNPTEGLQTQLNTPGAIDMRILDGATQVWRSSGREAKIESGRWPIDRQVRLVAGSLVLSGVLSSLFVPRAKWFSAAVGLGLLSSGITGTCGMAKLLGLLPYNRPSDEESTQKDPGLSSDMTGA